MKTRRSSKKKPAKPTKVGARAVYGVLTVLGAAHPARGQQATACRRPSPPIAVRCLPQAPRFRCLKCKNALRLFVSPRPGGLCEACYMRPYNAKVKEQQAAAAAAAGGDASGSGQPAASGAGARAGKRRKRVSVGRQRCLHGAWRKRA